MIRFFLSSISTFDAIAFVIIMLATIAAAWKAPYRIRLIGKLTEAIFLTSLSVQVLSFTIRLQEQPYRGGDLHVQTVFCDDFRAMAALIILAAVAYIINNILYIIRTPRL